MAERKPDEHRERLSTIRGAVIFVAELCKSEEYQRCSGVIGRSDVNTGVWVKKQEFSASFVEKSTERRFEAAEGRARKRRDRAERQRLWKALVDRFVAAIIESGYRVSPRASARSEWPSRSEVEKQSKRGGREEAASFCLNDNAVGVEKRVSAEDFGYIEKNRKEKGSRSFAFMTGHGSARSLSPSNEKRSRRIGVYID